MVVMVCVAIYLLYRRKSKAAAERMAKQFSLIEILIAISIIVTFSGLTSAVYSDKLIDSKISYTKIELNQILQHIYLYYTMNGRYPVSLTDLENIKSVASLEDPWNQPYIYVPPINWTHILELLQKPNLSENELTYHMECLQGLSSCLASLGQSDIDPRIILVESSKNPVLFSFGYRKPIFVGSMEDYQTTNNTQTNEFRERIQLVAQWIKLAREKSVSSSILIIYLQNILGGFVEIPKHRTTTTGTIERIIDYNCSNSMTRPLANTLVDVCCLPSFFSGVGT